MALGCTVKELLRRIDSAELSEWMAYYRIDPFGEERADLRQAITSSVIANAFRGKNSRVYKTEEFMVVRPKRKRKRMTGGQIKQSVKAFFGGGT